MERHVHKNGGSTIRDAMLENERRGGWMYWGFSLGRVTPVFDELHRQVAALPASNSTLRLAIEYHHAFIEFNPTVLEHVRDLRLGLRLHRVNCPIVLVTRLREPYSFYISFYRWAVAWKQRKEPAKFGRNFTDWAPPNLQGALLLRSMNHMAAELVGVRDPKRKIFDDFDATSMRQAQDLLLHFDLVGTVERFDETLLLVADMTGLQHIAYSINNPTANSNWKRVVSTSDACADETVCRTHVERIAPYDVDLYRGAAERLDKLVSTRGPDFQRRLELFRSHLARRRVCVTRRLRKNKCRYYPINPQRMNISRYTCPLLAQQAPLCDAINANREVRCPWNYRHRRHG